MNIFVLDSNPTKAAQFACDKHVVKMVLETAQILCTVRQVYKLDAPYRAFNPKHPCCIWAAESQGNYDWLLKHGLALCKEYTKRYKKIHRCQSIITFCKKNSAEIPFEKKQRTPFALAMPDHCQVEGNPVESYRNFYRQEKSRFAEWRHSPIPNWYNSD